MFTFICAWWTHTHDNMHCYAATNRNTRNFQDIGFDQIYRCYTLSPFLSLNSWYMCTYSVCVLEVHTSLESTGEEKREAFTEK